MLNEKTIQAQITDAVMAVCPIDGISFGNMDDKTSWVIQFRPEATPAQRVAGQAVIDNWPMDEEPA